MPELKLGADGQRKSEGDVCLEEYVRQVQKHNADALGRLYDTTSPILYRLIYRIVGNAADAEEVLLDVFEQIWRTAHTFDPVRGGVRRWLMLLARSRALDRLRKTAGRQLREQPVLEDYDLTSDEPHPEEVSVLSQQQYLLKQALAKLPVEQRQPLELAYFSGLSHTEIASTLGVPLGTIKTRIRSAMEKLRVAFCATTAGESSDCAIS